MYEYLEKEYVNNISFLLITSNLHLQIGKCAPWGTCTPGWEPLP